MCSKNKRDRRDVTILLASTKQVNDVTTRKGQRVLALYVGPSKMSSVAACRGKRTGKNQWVNHNTCGQPATQILLDSTRGSSSHERSENSTQHIL